MSDPRYDIDQNDELDDLNDFFGDDSETILEEPNEPVEDFDLIDETITDIDFSSLTGDFRSGLKHIDKKLKAKKNVRKRVLSKNIPVQKKATIHGRNPKKMGRVLVPRDRKVIVEGVNKFILSNNPTDEATKNVGYYKGKKLRELVLTFNNNDSAIDFNLELFNPSMPLDYLQTTSQNLNNKIEVAGAGNDVSYSDVLFNLLANPTLIPNAKFVVSGPSILSQTAQALIFKNKTIEGKEKVIPYQLSLQLDNMQVQSDIIYFDIMGGLNRPFIPDGMDVIQYKVLAGMSVTFCFYFKQKSLKKLLFKEARNSKRLM